MNSENSLVEVEGGANIAELQRVYQEECGPVENGWDRIRSNDDTRFCRWDGQSADGKKWDANLTEGAFPWDGASDSRVPLADEVVNDGVDLCLAAYHRALASVRGAGPGDYGAAAEASAILDWVRREELHQELWEEVELHAQYGLTYGVSVLYVTWAREWGWKRHPVKATELLALAGEMGMDAGTVAAILTGPDELAAVELARGLYGKYVELTKPADMEWEGKEMGLNTARELVRGLNSGEEVEVVLPYVCVNRPCVRALRVGDDVFVPSGTGRDLQEARVIVVREMMGVSEFRATGKAAGWDEEWMEAVEKEKGWRSSWKSEVRTGTGQVFDGSRVEESEYVEVLFGYRRLVDEDGVRGVFVTVFHGAVTKDASGRELYGKHELLGYGHGDYPVVGWRREVVGRRFLASRGVPEVMATWQRGVKVQEDAVTDQTSLGVVPPLLVPKLMGVEYRFGPGQQVPVEGGREPRLMDIPNRGTVVAFELMDRIEKRVDRYFGRRRLDTPPDSAVTKQQRLVTGFLASVSGMWRQVFALCRQFMPEEEWARVVGRGNRTDGTEMTYGSGGGGMAHESGETVGASKEFVLSFDVTELATDMVLQKLKVISEHIVPEDVGGVIDRNKLTLVKLRAVDPNLARELVMDQGSASQEVFRKVREQVAQMFLGNEAEYVEMDPTAPAKLEYVKGIVGSNPNYAGALRDGTNERFRELLEKYVKNLEMSVSQEENKMRGRIGV